MMRSRRSAATAASIVSAIAGLALSVDGLHIAHSRLALLDIFLALFVLASPNRLAQPSDLRANLDLQIDLLSEREMTAVLQLLQDIARAMDVKTSVTPDQISDLVKKTDVKALARQVDPP